MTIPQIWSQSSLCASSLTGPQAAVQGLICLPRAAADMCECMPPPASLPFDGPLLNVR